MPSYATGPSHHTSGPIDAVYAEWDAVGRLCTHCGAEVGSFCRRSDGTHKPVPCITRQRGRHTDTPDGPNDAPQGTQTAAMTQGEQP